MDLLVWTGRCTEKSSNPKILLFGFFLPKLLFFELEIIYPSKCDVLYPNLQKKLQLFIIFVGNGKNREKKVLCPDGPKIPKKSKSPNFFSLFVVRRCYSILSLKKNRDSMRRKYVIRATLLVLHWKQIAKIKFFSSSDISFNILKISVLKNSL